MSSKLKLLLLLPLVMLQIACSGAGTVGNPFAPSDDLDVPSYEYPPIDDVEFPIELSQDSGEIFEFAWLTNTGGLAFYQLYQSATPGGQQIHLLSSNSLVCGSGNAFDFDAGSELQLDVSVIEHSSFTEIQLVATNNANGDLVGVVTCTDSSSQRYTAGDDPMHPISDSAGQHFSRWTFNSN